MIELTRPFVVIVLLLFVLIVYLYNVSMGLTYSFNFADFLISGFIVVMMITLAYTIKDVTKDPKTKLIAFLLLFMGVANSVSIYQGDSETLNGITVSVVEHTDQCLTNCYTIYNISTTRDLSSNVFSLIIRDRENRGVSRTSTIFHQELQEVPKYCLNTTERQFTIPANRTGGEENVTETITRRVQCGTEMKPVYVAGYPGLLNGESVILKVETRKKPFENVDNILSIDSNQFREFAWWNSSWNSCVEIYLNQNGFPTNFTHQINLTIGNFNYTNAKADLTDLRALEGTCNNPNLAVGELGIWNQTVNTSGQSEILIKTITPNVGTISLFYGNPSATSAFNISKATLVGDDFLGSSLDSSIWRNTTINTCNFITVQNGVLNLSAAVSGACNVFTEETNYPLSYLNTSRIHYRYFFETNTGQTKFMIIRNGSQGGDGNAGLVSLSMAGTSTGMEVYNGTTGSSNNTVTHNLPERTQYTFTAQNGSIYNMTYPLRVIEATGQVVTAIGGGYWPKVDTDVFGGFGVQAINNRIVSVDWMYAIRNYSAGIPNYTIGDEQNLSLPALSFDAPTPSNNSNLSQTFIDVNVSVTLSGSLDTINISLYNSSNALNNSTTCASSPCYVNFTGLDNGIYYFNATANDTTNNSNISQTRTVTLDTTFPTISYQDPTPANNSVLVQTFLDLNVSATDSGGITNISLYLFNSTNDQVGFDSCASSPCITNFTSLGEGLYYMNATATDIAGNLNATATLTVTVNTSNPAAVETVTLRSPINESWIFQDNFDANIYVTQNASNITTVNCRFKVDGTIEETTTVTTETYTWTPSIFVANMTEGKHELNASCSADGYVTFIESIRYIEHKELNGFESRFPIYLIFVSIGLGLIGFYQLSTIRSVQLFLIANVVMFAAFAGLVIEGIYFFERYITFGLIFLFFGLIASLISVYIEKKRKVRGSNDS